MSFNRCDQTSAAYRDSKERNQCVIRFSVLHSFYTQQQTIVYADWMKGNIYTDDFTCFLPLYFLAMRVSPVKRMRL